MSSESKQSSPIGVEQAAKDFAIKLGWPEEGTAEHNDMIKAFIAGSQWALPLPTDEDLQRLVSMVCDQLNAGFAGREAFCKATVAHWRQSLPAHPTAVNRK